MKNTVKKGKKGASQNHQLQEIQKLTIPRLLPLMNQGTKELEAAAEEIQATLESFPAGSLRVSPHRGAYQYFHVSGNRKQQGAVGGSRGIYIPKAQVDLARGLAQKSYNEKMLGLFARGAAALKKALQEFERLKIDGSFCAQGPGRCPLIAPIYLPNDIYADRWQKEEFQGKPFYEDEVLLTTAKGERVRSKSEVIIANTLNQLSIPYRYEYPLKLSSGRVVYPDFTCLNIRTRDEFIWEHFGRMNDADYQAKTFRKLDSFAVEGYIHGINLIYTMENDVRPVNPKTIEILARTFLL